MKDIILSRGDWIVLRGLTATEGLRRKLERAYVVRPELVPAEVVTMDSRFVCIDESSHEREVLTLAYPRDAFGGPGRVSVLAPLGTELLGTVSGQTVALGSRRLRIGALLYQPERTRHFAAPLGP